MIINKNEINEYKSKCGNRFYKISSADCFELLKGKVLYLNDMEYSTFVCVSENNEND